MVFINKIRHIPECFASQKSSYTNFPHRVITSIQPNENIKEIRY